MSNYTKSTNFATKDNLTPGDPLKVVRGTEIDTEFNNIATAIVTKTDNSAAAITGGAIDGATVGATTPATGSFTTLAASGTTTLAGALVGAATQAAFNTVSTTLNLGGAATAVNLGAATGTATVNNTTLAAKAITASTTLAVTGTSTLTGAVTATAGVTGPITSSSVSITGGSITGITDLAVADGGTGASTAAGGLNNLLPTQTGNANKYLQTDGTNATWDAVTLSTADITGTLPVANGGTGVTTSTGTTNVVLSNSPTLVTPTLGVATATSLQGIIGNVTPAAGNFTTLGASSTATLNTLSSSGATLTGGTINGMTVGATTASTGAFTSVTASTTLGVTGVATFSAGTLSLPAITTTGDTNTGIFFPAADTVATTVGGVEGTRLTSTGLGIGTSSPAAKFEVSASFADSAIEEIARISRTGGTTGYATNRAGALTFFDTPNSTLTGAVAGVRDIAVGNFRGSLAFYTTNAGAQATSVSSLVERLRINSDGNVGIGTLSPDANLTVNGAASFSAGTAALPAIARAGDLNTGIWFPAADTVAASTGGTERLRLDSSGNLGLGVTPSAWTTLKVMQFAGGASLAGFGNTAYINANTYFDGSWRYIASTTAGRYEAAASHKWFTSTSGTAGNALSETQVLTLDTSGNLRLGGSPNAWTTSFGAKAFQFTEGGALFGLDVSSSDRRIYLSNNEYFNSSNSPIYINTAAATRYQQTVGQHRWFNAPSGTAGDVITFTQAMTLDASGNLLVGTTSTGPVNANAITIEPTNSRIRVAHSGTGNTTPYIQFDYNGSNIASITQNTTSTVAYNTTTSTTTGAQLNASGVTFPATQVASADANTLDDYEEGTWTPALKFGGNSVGMTGTFTGNYTKIGNTVNVQVRVVLTNKGSSTGNATIEGLPFTSSTYPAAIVDPSNDFVGLVTGGATYVGLGSTSAYFLQQSTTARTNMTQANFGNAADMRFTVTYIV